RWPLREKTVLPATVIGCFGAAACERQKDSRVPHSRPARRGPRSRAGWPSLPKLSEGRGSPRVVLPAGARKVPASPALLFEAVFLRRRRRDSGRARGRGAPAGQEAGSGAPFIVGPLTSPPSVCRLLVVEQHAADRRARRDHGRAGLCPRAVGERGR